MKWSMDTHKYISEITRKALQIMVAHNISRDSDASEIDAVERELAANNIYHDYESAKGRVRRALFTYFNAYGCMTEEGHLTQLGRLYAENRITIQEFCFYYLINYTYENGDHKYYPVRLILNCLKELYGRNPAEAYLTAYDFSKIVDCNDYGDINDVFINAIIEAHAATPVTVNERAIGFDVWAKMLVQAGLLDRTTERTLVIKNHALLNWVLSAYNNPISISHGVINTGALKYIPLPTITDANGAVAPFENEGKALQAFLFDRIDDGIIQKYIFRSVDASFENMKVALGLKEQNRAFYQAFIGLEHLVGYVLAGNDNLAIKTIGEILASVELTEDELQDISTIDVQVEVVEEDRVTGGTNILLYGVPGSGKSWTIEHEYCKPGTLVDRLVFHPDYTNADFVGQILPVVDPVDKQVTYEFTPGPFTNILREAYQHPQKKYVLIIEEINRGNAPAIFGDVFQLLDRTFEPKTVDGITYPVGTSEYGITNENVAKVVYGDGTHKIRIPSNLSILGTMNTSDQNVFTLDTAFQRRWRMRLIENNFNNVRGSLARAKILDTEVTWELFCTTINTIIIGNKAKMASAEDKRLGVYFIHENDITFDTRALPSDGYDTLWVEYDALMKKELLHQITPAEETRLEEIRDAVIHNRIFPEKVIKYLWDDAFKFNPEAIFDTDNMESLEQVIRTFVYSKGEERYKVFNQKIRQLLHPNQQ